jgi:hypothetical protein
MFNRNTPMQLGDIFSITFELLKSTLLKSLIVVLAFMIPAAFILTAGFNSLFTDLYLKDENVNPVETFTAITILIGYLSSISFYMLLFLAAWIGVITIASRAIQSENFSAGDGFRSVFSVTYIKVLGQLLLIGLIFGGCMAVPFILIALGGGFQSSILIIAGVLIFMAAAAFVIYLVYRWYFASTHIIISGDRILNSLSKSSYLVKNYWWRTFGILLLITLVVDFAVSIISTPLFFFVMWDYLSAVFSSPEAFEGGEMSPIFMSVFTKIGYIIAFTSAIQLLITPLFTVVMYYDLRIRKDDLDGNQPVQDDPFSPGEPSFGS